MKWTVLFMLLVMGTGSVFSQEATEEKKLTRKERKEIRKKESAIRDSIATAYIGRMVENQKFALEATQLKTKGGTTHVVSSGINFLLVDSTTATMQLGAAHLAGINGMGGVTIEGSVSDYKYSYNERSKMYRVSYSMRTSGGVYSISISAGGSSATARVTTLRGGVLNYTGKLQSLEESVIYKGIRRR